jgi:hypothetical protein
MHLLTFAQHANDLPADFDPAAYDFGYDPLAFDVCSILGSAISLFVTAFWIWMLVDCIRREPDRYFWFWVILVIFPLGATVYFFMRWVPHNELQPPKFLRNWTRGGERRRMETAAAQIGNAHQFVGLGDFRRDMGQFGAAGEAYARALEKEPRNMQALWGAALVDMRLRDFASAKESLETALKIDPQYKFGDVSVAYGRALYELGAREEAERHLQGHVKRWRHPEALFVLATILNERGDVGAARLQLTDLLQDVHGCPKAIARKFGRWRSKARRLLRSLPKT